MATQQERITALAQAIANDIKKLTDNQGSLTALNTTAKNNLVAALNELKQAIDSKTSINDSATTTANTWSADKTQKTIDLAISGLINGAGTTLDTLKELADALGNDANFATTIAAQMGKRVRVDAPQTFTVTEQAQGCANLGIGNPDTDFVAAYNTAKA